MIAEKEIKLKQVMEERQLSVARLSELSGIRPGTLYRRLRGESDFKAEDILKISRGLRLTEKEILNIFFNTKVS